MTILEKLKDENTFYKIHKLYAIYDVAHKAEATAIAIEEENGSHKERVRPVYIILNDDEYKDNEAFILDDYSSRHSYDYDVLKMFYLDEYVRECSVCKELTHTFFIVEKPTQSDYYCSKNCLHKEVSPEEYERLYEEDSAYYTETL